MSIPSKHIDVEVNLKFCITSNGSPSVMEDSSISYHCILHPSNSGLQEFHLAREPNLVCCKRNRRFTQFGCRKLHVESDSFVHIASN